MISAPARRYDYVTAPEEIYRRSFATIRSETDLSRLPEDLHPLAVRMIHACGDVDLVNDLAFHPRLASTARTALEAHAVIFTDTQMLAAGITRRRLPGRQSGLLPARRPASGPSGDAMGNYPIGGRRLALERPAGRCSGSDWQCSHRPVPPLGADRRWRPTSRCDYRNSRWLRRLRGVEDRVG